MDGAASAVFTQSGTFIREKDSHKWTAATMARLATPRSKQEKLCSADFDAAAHDKRTHVVDELRHLPKPPIMRNECAFLDETYARVVRARRQRQLTDEAETRRRRITKTEDLDDLLAQRAQLREEERQQCQEQWLTIISVALFGKLMTKASETAALSVLRRLFAPIVRRVRNNLRKRKRQAVIMQHFAPGMRPICPEELHQTCAAFSWWPLQDVRSVCEHFQPRGVGPGTLICGEGSTEFGVGVLDEGVVEVVQKTTILARKLEPTLPAVKVVMSLRNAGASFAELSVLMPATPLPVGFRAGDRRVLFWHLPGNVYNEALSALKARNELIAPKKIPIFFRSVVQASEANNSGGSDGNLSLAHKMTRAAVACRQQLVPLLYNPTPQALQNCGRNRLFHVWNDDQLRQLTEVMRPVSFAAGDALFVEGEQTQSCFFLANGVVELLSTNPLAFAQLHRNLKSGTQPQGQLLPPISGAVAGVTGASTEERSHGTAPSRGIALSRTQSSLSTMGAGVPAASGPGQLVATLGPWQSIGDEGIMTADRHDATVVAKTDVDGWMCQRTDLLQILAGDPGLHIKTKQVVNDLKAERLGFASRDPLLRSLAAHPILSTCTPTELSSLARVAVPRWFAAHDTITPVTSNECPVIVIVSGIARSKVSNQQRVLTASEQAFPLTVGPGAVIGAAASLTGGSWYFPFTVEATTPVEAWEISCENLQRVLRGSHGGGGHLDQHHLHHANQNQQYSSAASRRRGTLASTSLPSTPRSPPQQSTQQLQQRRASPTTTATTHGRQSVYSLAAITAAPESTLSRLQTVAAKVAREVASAIVVVNSDAGATGESLAS